jgi:serine/threonine protein kinase
VEGLEFIYSRGYIHGNLKPGNILLDTMLKPLLSDFGLPGRLVPGSVGSPYMAPEQVQGGVVDRRADVYALGALLYATLAGAEPPAGVVVSPRSSRPDLPESVEMVIFKAMAQNPDQRFQSATEFFNAMQTALVTPQPVSPPVYQPAPAPAVAPVPTVSQTVNVESQKRGTNWVGIIIAIFVLIALCLGAIFLYQNYSQNHASAPVATNPPVTQPTIVQPTNEPNATKAPRPTKPANEQPTNPPETQPTNPPENQPTRQPPGGGSPICGSLGLIVLPMAVIGANRFKKKRTEAKSKAE